ncbi:hypothetical protein ONZ45_g5973 [Pleurotus djamor]|nr:hypothetical protein ONZ45_g5973 [Pleurotus djamor]
MTTRNPQRIYSLQSYNRKPQTVPTDPLNPWGAHPFFQRRRKIINIPQDVINDIFDFLESNTPSLKNASLVCHSWWQPCKTRLFKSVRFLLDVSDVYRGVHPRYRIRLHKPEEVYANLTRLDLLGLVRHLEVRIIDGKRAHMRIVESFGSFYESKPQREEVTLPVDTRFLGSFSNLETFTVYLQLRWESLQMLPVTGMHQSQVAFGDALKRIPLILTSVNDSKTPGVHSKRTLLKFAPSLKRVIVKVVAPSTGEPFIHLLVPRDALLYPRERPKGDDENTNRVLSYHLDEIHFEASSATSLFNLLAQKALDMDGGSVQILLDRLRILSLMRVGCLGGLAGVNSMLLKCAGSIERISLAIGTLDVDAYIPVLDLHKLPRLKCLTLTKIPPNYPSHTIVNSLQQIGISELKSVSFEFFVSPENINVPNSDPHPSIASTDLAKVISQIFAEWSQLDDALCRLASTGTLREVTLKITALVGGHLDSSVMPSIKEQLLPKLAVAKVRLLTSTDTQDWHCRCCLDFHQ